MSSTSLLRGQRRPGTVARLHVKELVLFVAVIWIGGQVWGVPEAVAFSLHICAYAWLLLDASDRTKHVLKVLISDNAPIMAVLAANLSLQWTSPVHVVITTTIGLAFLAQAGAQLPVQHRDRMAALLRWR